MINVEMLMGITYSFGTRSDIHKHSRVTILLNYNVFTNIVLLIKQLIIIIIN